MAATRRGTTRVRERPDAVSAERARRRGCLDLRLRLEPRQRLKVGAILGGIVCFVPRLRFAAREQTERDDPRGDALELGDARTERLRRPPCVAALQRDGHLSVIAANQERQLEPDATAFV